MSPDTYLFALRLLSRRELSEKQVRQRLARDGHDTASIEVAVSRLKANRSIDDLRVATLIARRETAVRRRGKLRVRQQIEAAGISPVIAAQAVDEAFADLDPDALLGAALDKRLHGRDQIADDREFQRLYRYLMGQGFESDTIIRALEARRRK